MFASLTNFTSASKLGESPTSADDLSEVAVKQYKAAMRQHKHALRELERFATTFSRALQAVARSFQRLAAGTRSPVVIHSSGTLLRGIEEVSKGDLLDDLLTELDVSLFRRFAKAAAAQAMLKDCRRRKRKADVSLAELRAQCW